MYLVCSIPGAPLEHALASWLISDRPRRFSSKERDFSVWGFEFRHNHQNRAGFRRGGALPWGKAVQRGGNRFVLRLDSIMPAARPCYRHGPPFALQTRLRSPRPVRLRSRHGQCRARRLPLGKPRDALPLAPPLSRFCRSCRSRQEKGRRSGPDIVLSPGHRLRIPGRKGLQAARRHTSGRSLYAPGSRRSEGRVPLVAQPAPRGMASSRGAFGNGRKRNGRDPNNRRETDRFS